MKTVLTIAGSDSSGGAGIQADLKTMLANGVYGMSAITALTAQNTTGVSAIMEVAPEFLEKQLDAVFTDIRPDAVKIGMVSSAQLIKVIAERLSFYQAEHIVADPVMVATSGARLIGEDAVEMLKERLLPLAALATPNIPEAEVLSGCEIRSEEDMETAARIISQTYGCSVLLKGGHRINDANDYLYRMGHGIWLYGKGSTIPIPMVPAVPCPAPLLPTWQREWNWRLQSLRRSGIFLLPWKHSLIWEGEAAPWITALLSGENIKHSVLGKL